MTILKPSLVSAAAHWKGGRLARIKAPGKPGLEAESRSEIGEGVTIDWSSEELLVGAIASSFAVTLAAVAKRVGVEI